MIEPVPDRNSRIHFPLKAHGMARRFTVG